MTEYHTIKEAILLVNQKNLQRVIVEDDSYLVINSFRDKIDVHKDIISLVKDIKILSALF